MLTEVPLHAWLIAAALTSLMGCIAAVIIALTVDKARRMLAADVSDLRREAKRYRALHLNDEDRRRNHERNCPICQGPFCDQDPRWTR